MEPTLDGLKQKIKQLIVLADAAGDYLINIWVDARKNQYECLRQTIAEVGAVADSALSRVERIIEGKAK